MVFIYRCFIAGLCDFTITFYLYPFIYGLLSEINQMYVCIGQILNSTERFAFCSLYASSLKSLL